MARAIPAIPSQQLSRQLYHLQLQRQAQQRRQRQASNARAVTRAAPSPAKSHLDSLGYREQSALKAFVGFFTPITIFIILLKLSMCWVIYTMIEDHLSYMERELVTDYSSG